MAYLFLNLLWLQIADDVDDKSSDNLYIIHFLFSGLSELWRQLV